MKDDEQDERDEREGRQSGRFGPVERSGRGLDVDDGQVQLTRGFAAGIHRRPPIRFVAAKGGVIGGANEGKEKELGNETLKGISVAGYYRQLIGAKDKARDDFKGLKFDEGSSAGSTVADDSASDSGTVIGTVSGTVSGTDAVDAGNAGASPGTDAGTDAGPSRTDTPTGNVVPLICPVCGTLILDPRHSLSTVHLLATAHIESEPSPLVIGPSSLGYRYLVKQGWSPHDKHGLGVEGRKGRREPITARIKKDKYGLGVKINKVDGTIKQNQKNLEPKLIRNGKEAKHFDTMDKRKRQNVAQDLYGNDQLNSLIGRYYDKERH